MGSLVLQFTGMGTVVLQLTPLILYQLQITRRLWLSAGRTKEGRLLQEHNLRQCRGTHEV
jgi:hypothetical protein